MYFEVVRGIHLSLNNPEFLAADPNWLAKAAAFASDHVALLGALVGLAYVLTFSVAWDCGVVLIRCISVVIAVFREVNENA
jgi:hypothetical protein